jgi:hypothetical protein
MPLRTLPLFYIGLSLYNRNCAPVIDGINVQYRHPHRFAITGSP